MRVERIRLGKKHLGVLSPLEMDVLSTLWAQERAMRVRDIHSHVGKKREVALTSVAVILDRLHEKRMVRRTVSNGRGGSYYMYSSRVSREGFQEQVIDRTVNKLIEHFGTTAVNYFHERFAKEKKKVAG